MNMQSKKTKNYKLNKYRQKMESNSNKTIVRWFCVVFVIILSVFVVYLWHSTSIFNNSQEKIINEHRDHIAKVDSIFYDMKAVILSNDSGTVENAPALLSQLQKDSALFRREILLSQEEMTNLVALHIDKVDNDYSQIGIWGGLLSIIFLIFGFFAIFKIEETKAEAKNVLEEVKEKGKNATDEIEELQNQASELNNSFNSIKQESTTLITNKTTEFNELTESIHSIQKQSNERLERINKLLEDVENKNKQYNWSIETMSDQMKQLEELTDMLKEIIKKEGKEDSNE